MCGWYLISLTSTITCLLILMPHSRSRSSLCVFVLAPPRTLYPTFHMIYTFSIYPKQVVYIYIFVAWSFSARFFHSLKWIVYVFNLLRLFWPDLLQRPILEWMAIRQTEFAECVAVPWANTTHTHTPRMDSVVWISIYTLR